MNIVFNGQPRQVDADLTVSELLSGLELNAARVAVEVNLQLVPRSEHSLCTLCDGDQIEVVTLAGGG